MPVCLRTRCRILRIAAESSTTKTWDSIRSFTLRPLTLVFIGERRDFVKRQVWEERVAMDSSTGNGHAQARKWFGIVGVRVGAAPPAEAGSTSCRFWL